MKLFPIFAMVIFCNFPSFCTSGDKVVDAIEASDPEAVRDLLIPGFLIRLPEKKRYVALAQEITNNTHALMHKFSTSDLFDGAKGLAYLGFGAALGYFGLDYWAAKRKWRFMWEFGNFKLAIKAGDAKDSDGATKSDAGAQDNGEISPFSDKVIVGILCALGTYFTARGLETFHNVLTKKKRVDVHNNALTVEAIIQRLPAFDKDSICFVPGSWQEKDTQP